MLNYSFKCWLIIQLDLFGSDVLSHKSYIERCSPNTICIFSCRPLTMLRGERVVSSIETQDGYCCVGEFFAWASVVVVVRTRFITKQQRGEAFVKLPDSTCLQERDETGWEEGRQSHKQGDCDRGVKVKNGPYLQDIINIHYFLQNLPMPVRNRFSKSWNRQRQFVKLNSRTTWLTCWRRDTSRLWGICWRAASWAVPPWRRRTSAHPRGQRW